MKYKWIELQNYAGIYNGMQINQIKIDAVSNDGTSSGTLYQLEKENLEKDKKISRIEKQIKTQAFEYEIKLSCLKLQLNQEETLIKNKKIDANFNSYSFGLGLNFMFIKKVNIRTSLGIDYRNTMVNPEFGISICYFF